MLVNRDLKLGKETTAKAPKTKDDKRVESQARVEILMKKLKGF
jgi:hypothetical protein